MKFNEDAMSYEASLRTLVEKSNKRAWAVAWISVFLVILMGGLIAYMLPLKKTEPYVVKVDKSTGMVDVVTAIDKKTMNIDSAIDKHFTSSYVKKRESYYYDLLEQDYIYVQLLSNNKVAKEYREIFHGQNALDKIYKNNIEVKGTILSVVLGESAGTKTATVRILLTKLDAHTGAKLEESIKVATLSYEYFPEMEQKESDRLINPLGFQVLTYRIDDEVKQ